MISITVLAAARMTVKAGIINDLFITGIKKSRIEAGFLSLFFNYGSIFINDLLVIIISNR